MGYITPVEDTNSEHSYYIYALKHPKANIIMKKIKAVGVPCGIYYPVPLHRQGAFVSLGYKEGEFPVTEDLSKTTFAIPVFPELYEEERDYIVKALNNARR